MAKKKTYVATFRFEGRRYYRYGATQAEAYAKAAESKFKMQHQLVEDSLMPVNRWFETYLDVYKKRADLKTLSDYRGFYKNAIAPFIGQKPLKTVKAADCQRIMNNLSGKSLSYVRKVKNLLTGLFKTAVLNGLINRSPAEGLLMPDAEEGSRRALTPSEREAFLAAAAECGVAGQFHLLIYHTGLRPSEAAKLRDEDVDWRRGVIHIAGGKTKAAKRDVPIPAGLELPQREGLLFPTKTGSTPQKTARQKWWNKIARKMEEISGAPTPGDLTAYCLRHDFCTRLQEAGVPIDVARRLMGHSSIEVTSKIYTHASDMALEQARELINARAAKQAEQPKEQPPIDTYRHTQTHSAKTIRPM